MIEIRTIIFAEDNPRDVELILEALADDSETAQWKGLIKGF